MYGCAGLKYRQRFVIEQKFFRPLQANMLLGGLVEIRGNLGGTPGLRYNN